MTKIVDYYFTITSPWTFLGSQRLVEMARRHGAEIRAKPVSYAVIFPATGGLPLPKRAPERQAYRLMELKRWQAHLGIELNLHPKFFPAPDADAARVVIAAERAGGDHLTLAHAFLAAVWTQEKDITDHPTLAEIASANGHDGAALVAASQEPEVQAAYEAQTQEALDRGVFGAPTYIYKDELFWGQDRLDFLDRALADE
jgi:2-hydroxychromene-2-carboxylate isomerase